MSASPRDVGMPILARWNGGNSDDAIAIIKLKEEIFTVSSKHNIVDVLKVCGSLRPQVGHELFPTHDNQSSALELEPELFR